MKLVRPIALATLTLAAACSRRETAKPLTSDEIDPSDAGKDAGPTRAEIAAQLARYAVTDADFARAIFYTWTSPDQIAEVRKGGTLLIKDGSTKPSGFEVELDALWAKRTTGSDVAQILRTHPGLAKQRYAWTAPFATRKTIAPSDPPNDHGYGDALVRVVLRDDAYVGHFDASLADPWAFSDMRGRPVPSWEVAAHPERLGAIQHVATLGPAPVAYREYVLCNESMIDEWSVATPEIRAEVDGEIALLGGLIDVGFDAPPSTPLASLSSGWHAASDLSSLDADWSAAIAFANASYVPTKKNLEDLVRVMRLWDPTPPALVVHPKVIFPPWPPPPSPPPPVAHPHPMPAW